MAQLTTINPATNETLKQYDLMSDQDVEQAIELCHAAYEDWRLTSLAKRASVIRAIADALRARKDEYAELMTRETGKRFQDGQAEIELCASICI